MHRSNLLPLALLFLTGSLFSQEWTRFHGPNGTGISPTKMPTSWTDKDYEWKLQLPGQGHSSPALWGNKLFTTCADHDKAIQYFLCVNAISGKVLWKKKHQSKNYHIHKFSSYASATPAANEKFVIFTWTTKESDIMLCMDHEGNEKWRRDFGPYDTQHGNGNSAMIHKGVVYYTHCHFGDSKIFALDVETGNVIASIARKSAKPSHSTPCVRIGANGKEEIVFTSDAHGVFALSPRNLNELWESGDKTFNKRCVLSPVLVGNYVLGSCGSGGGGNYIVAVQPSKKQGEAPTEVWRIKKAAPYVPTALAYKDSLYLIDDKGIATCVDPSDASILWQQRLGANYFGSPVTAGNHIYILSTTGDVHILEASKEFKHLKPVSLGEKAYSTPAIANGRMYLRTYSQLFCLKGKN